MFYWQFINGTTNETWTQAAVLTADYFRNCVNTVIPTWFQSKLFTSEVPTSQQSQTDANVAIRPKKIISNMLVLIPVIHGKKWFVSSLSFFYPFAKRTQWDIEWYIGCFYASSLARNRHTLGRLFEVGLRFFLCQISCSNFWVDRNFETSAQKLFDSRFRLNYHKIPSSFSLWYPNISYNVTCSSQMKWLSGFILCTLYSSDHCEIFSL